MSATRSPNRELRELLMELFSVSELKLFVSDWYPGLENRVPWGGTLTEAAQGVITTLRSDGLINTELFAHLAEERSGKSAKIEEICRICLASTKKPQRPSTGSAWVDKGPPVDWTRDEPKLLRKILSTAYTDRDSLTHLAESAGITRGSVDWSGPAQIVAHRLIERAVGAAKLRALVEEMVNDRSIAAFHAELRGFLG